MGNCIYCGKPAGFLRSKHAECEQQYLQRQRVIEEGKERIAVEVSRVIKGTEEFAELEKTIAEVETASFVPSAERNALLIKAWETSVEHFLEDGLLDETEESDSSRSRIILRCHKAIWTNTAHLQKPRRLLF